MTHAAIAVDAMAEVGHTNFSRPNNKNWSTFARCDRAIRLSTASAENLDAGSGAAYASCETIASIGAKCGCCSSLALMVDFLNTRL